MSFRLVPKSVTSNDLEQRNGRYCALSYRIWQSCQALSCSWSWRILVLVFSKRQRITLRLLMAIAIPSVCRLPVCRLSVTLVHPTQAVELFGNFFHHTIAQGLYFSGAKIRWWGTPLSP